MEAADGSDREDPGVGRELGRQRGRTSAFTNPARVGLDTGKNPTRAWLYEASGNYFDVLKIALGA